MFPWHGQTQKQLVNGSFMSRIKGRILHVQGFLSSVWYFYLFAYEKTETRQRSQLNKETHVGCPHSCQTLEPLILATWLCCWGYGQVNAWTHAKKQCDLTQTLAVSKAVNLEGVETKQRHSTRRWLSSPRGIYPKTPSSCLKAVLSTPTSTSTVVSLSIKTYD